MRSLVFVTLMLFVGISSADQLLINEKKFAVELTTEYAQYIRFTSAAHGTVVKIDEAL